MRSNVGQALVVRGVTRVKMQILEIALPFDLNLFFYQGL